MPRRKLLSEIVTNGILEMIDTGQIQKGEQIPTEEELANQFEVSRTSIRTATKMLIASGVLETRRGIGTFVCNPISGPLRTRNLTDRTKDDRELSDLLELRIIFEPEVAKLASERVTKNDLDELERCVIELQKGVNNGIKPDEDLGFHLALANSTKNSAIIDVSMMIVNFYEKDIYLPEDTDVSEHKGIFEAVRDGKGDLAFRRMKKHLEGIRERYANN
jgi:DNA-binding FadR family transcriptional regulator